SFEKELEALEQLCSRSVDGVVIVSHVFSEKNIRTDRFRSDNIPLVAIADVKDSGVCSLNFDIAVSMDELFEHLTDNGLRRIAFVDYSVYPGKYEAYRDSTRKFGIKEEYYTDFADFADDYDRLVAQILQDLPEVIIAGSDWIGAELIHRFSAAGVAVPDQLAVATIDGTVLSATYNPPLTAIRSDIPMLAKTAIDIIVERIKGNTDLITKTIPTKLLIRQSTQKKGQKK
ncbi:MAG: substrate-binding domain-containing protein, partial [Victivallales bacterium]|nr:substrate-binding domain-containing protein [Victivallales bacterium]